MNLYTSELYNPLDSILAGWEYLVDANHSFIVWIGDQVWLTLTCAAFLNNCHLWFYALFERKKLFVFTLADIFLVV